jgi:hypothetical protein
VARANCVTALALVDPLGLSREELPEVAVAGGVGAPAVTVTLPPPEGSCMLDPTGAMRSMFQGGFVSVSAIQRAS